MARKITCKLMVVIFFSALSAMSHAGEVNLPKTGQTTCYDESGEVIDCAGTGQDGDVQAGVDWPSPRFVDNEDGTITGNLTGLVWLKNANCFGYLTWSDALVACNTLASGTCGLSDGSVAGDWRLPNIIELESLVNPQEANLQVWLNNQGFSNIQSSYWSATSQGYYEYAWMLFTHYGRLWNIEKIGLVHVLPVRNGQ